MADGVFYVRDQALADGRWAVSAYSSARFAEGELVAADAAAEVIADSSTRLVWRTSESERGIIRIERGPQEVPGAPDLWFVWSVLAGAAQGSGFTIVISATIALAASSHHAGRLGAVVQAGGYLAAATSPSILGAAHEATGGWDLPLVCVLIALLVFITAGVAASLRIRRATA